MENFMSSGLIQDDASDEGRESTHQLPDDQQTTSEEGNESAVGAQTDTPEDPSDLSENQVDAVEISGDPHEDFSDAVEPFFVKAERLIDGEHFDLNPAKDLVLTLRDLGQRHVTQGCMENVMEDIVLRRALKTVKILVDGVNLNQEEVYDPRQTMVYLYCALAVFPFSVRLGRQNNTVVFRLSPAGYLCFPMLEELNRYCALKTEHEGIQGWQNLIRHKQVLLDLAAWLEVERSSVTHLIANRTLPVLAILVEQTHIIGAVAGMSGVSSRLYRLWEIALVVSASSLVRNEFIREAEVLRRLLMKVDTSGMPPVLAARHCYVHARLLQNCGEFAKALDSARDALQGVTDVEERREIEQLINELNNALENASRSRDTHGPADPQWLRGTHALLGQSRTDLQEAVRQNHLAQTRRKRTRRVSVSRRGETPPRAPSADGRNSRGAVPGALRDVRNRSSSPRYSSSPCLSAHSYSPAGSGLSATVQPHGAAASASEDSLLHSDFLDDTDDEDDDVYDEDRDIHFVDEDDEDDDEDYCEERGDAEEAARNVSTVEAGAEEADQQDWFEKSEDAIADCEANEMEGEDIDISDRLASNLEKGGEGRSFYPDFDNDPEQLLSTNPNKYKRCQLKIERAHRSIAKVLDKGSKYTEILIEGRSKAGRTYMDDEVVVEILAEPGQNRGLHQAKGASSTGVDEAVEKLAHGKVVGLLKRVNFAYVEHPVLFCTLDEMEGHLMLPLCKTVPKIHVMNDTVRRKYPALKKNRIEVKRITADGYVEHRGFCNVQPDKREQYVFKVVILAWRQCNIYPLGAVLDFYISGRNYSGGLRVLSMQQRVPKLYPRDAVENTKKLLQQTPLTKTGREDLTGQRLFTIDPPGSKDLDDAVCIKKEGPHYVIGVHIADVAAVVKKGSGVDLEARRRAVTFYPLDRKPHPMLPEPLSHGKCSLLPGEERQALSVFFTFNENGRQVEEPVVKKTVIKSRAQLTYEEVQKVINEDARVDIESAVQADIRQLHKITSKLRESRQKLSMFFVPFEDPRLPELEKINDHMDAHSLIEELMILTNCYIATRLTRRPRLHDVMVLRCHKAPTYEELAEWRDKEGSVSNLVMQLQGKKVSPDTRLSLDTSTTRAGPARQQTMVVQSEVWVKLCRHLEQGEMTEARRLAFMDAVHPLQCLAASHWMDLMETAQYKCSYGLNTPDRRHFGLDVDVYTHFTSPIRRYADLHVQRLLHADLDGKRPDCTPDDVTELCQHINGATSRQRAFGKGCMALKVAESLQRQPLVFRAFVESVDTEQLTLCLPSLLKVSDRKQELPFSMLGVSCQPELVTDTMLRQDSVTVQWNRRIYNETETCPHKLRLAWLYLEKQGDNTSTPQREGDKKNGKKKKNPMVIYINPEQLSKSVTHEDWKDILKSLVPKTERHWQRVPQPVPRIPRPAEGKATTYYVEVDHMSSEKGDRTVSLRPVQFRRVYTAGQVVQVQMSAEPKKGMLKPRVEILHTARNASVCTQHFSDPVLALTRFAKRTTRDQNFSNYQDYARAWMPLLEMEAAVEAGKSDGGVVIENVSVKIKTQTQSNSLLYRGTFKLKAKFCFDRCIEFGGKSADTIEEEEFTSDNSFPLDYLCLRYKMDCSDIVVSRVKQSEVSETVDRQFTWLAHASVVRVNHKNKKQADGGDLVVTFVLSSSSPRPPPEFMEENGARVSMEILPKSDVDRRAQMMLLQLQDRKCGLAQAIAYGSKIPKLDSNHQMLGRKIENQEVDMQQLEETTRPLPPNNRDQLEAIRKAMTQSLALIQGPPGTGKTNTGIKLVYLFCKINRQLEAEGMGKKTVLYCGPSNKSVDLVARELKSKLGSKCPRIVRMYGSAFERKDYPIPRGDLRSTRSIRDIKSDPELQDVTLHHLIRQSDRPYADEIWRYDNHFEKCIENPRKYTVTSMELKTYRKLLTKASIEELVKYEVVLATCSVGGCGKLVEGTKNTIFQLIIDECAMSTEPQSMVPIIANQAQQVVLIGDHKQLRPIIKYQPAAELGLDQSLFERLFLKFPAYTAFLSTQYRMHPHICAFPSKEFYDNKLETGWSKLWTGPPLPFWPTKPLSGPSDRYPVVPHLLVDVRGEEETLTVTTEDGNEKSKSNSLEADKVVEILRFLKGEHQVQLSTVKILTQYNSQRHLLETKLHKVCEDRGQNVFDRYDKNKLKISTVVSSQGGEWDYVIMSTVRSLPSYRIEPNPTHGWCRQNLGFITDRNQVNVALTRARKGLFIVGNVELLRCDEVWRHLVERYERLGCCIRDASLFPPPPAPSARQRHVQRNASDHWQKETSEKTSGHICSNVMDRPSPSQYWAQQQQQLQQRLMNEQESKETQTDLDTADTHVKRVTDGLRSEGGFCPDNLNCSTDHGRHCQPSPGQDATVMRLLSANTSNTRDVPALNNGQVGNSGYQLFFENCTFNNNSKTKTHNNVENLNKMNIGSSHSTCNNMEAPARPKVSPPPEMPMVELPEEMRQQSLRPLQDPSGGMTAS